MSDSIPTRDIKLASILVSLGVPIRQTDPVTCVVDTSNGRRSEVFTFWFDVSASGMREKAKALVAAYEAARNWTSYTLDNEHPIYWMKGALENREVLLNWIRKDVKPMQILTSGNKTVLIGEHASPELRAKLRAML